MCTTADIAVAVAVASAVAAVTEQVAATAIAVDRDPRCRVLLVVLRDGQGST